MEFAAELADMMHEDVLSYVSVCPSLSLDQLKGRVLTYHGLISSSRNYCVVK